MNAEQARLTQLGAALLATLLRQDDEATTLMMADFAETPRAPEGLLYVSIVAAGTWCIAAGLPSTEIEELWPELLAEKDRYHVLADRVGMTQLATATATGDRASLLAAQERMGGDAGVLILSGLDLAMACLRALESRTGVSGAEWCRRFAEGSAAGAGVTE